MENTPYPTSTPEKSGILGISPLKPLVSFARLPVRGRPGPTWTVKASKAADLP